MALDLVRKDAKENSASELASNSSLRNVLDPTLMSDAEATKLGLKIYNHGIVYNNGNALTLSLSSGGGTLNTVNEHYFIPYQMKDGSWRLRFNFRVVLSATTRTTASIAITGGFTFDNHALSGYMDNGGAGLAFIAAFTNGGGNQFVLTNSSQSTQGYFFSGDVKISAKPNWAF